MHCPECGQEILAGSEFCGNCGAPVTRQQAEPVCANCGSPNQPGAEFCAECGARLGGEVMPMQSFCPECGAAVKEGAAFCKECGADLNATTASAPFVCPECGEPLPPDAAFCGNCGQVLQQGGEYAPAPATTAAEYQPSYPPERQDYSPQQDWVQPQTQPQAQDWEYSQQQAQYPPQGQPQPTIQQQGWTQQQPQKSNRNKMLMAAAATVVLLVIGITGFWKPGYLLDLFRPTAKLENGILALNDITLDFKQTNLSNGAATMTTVKDKEEEIHNGLIGDLYVMKIDNSCQGKVTVAIPVPKDYKPTNDDDLYIKLGIGQDYELEDGKTVRRYSYFDTEIKDGKAVAVIDPAALGQSLHRQKASAKSAEKAPDVGVLKEHVGVFYWKQIGKIPSALYGEGYEYSKGHFRVWYSYNVQRFKNVYMGGDDAQRLLSDLEDAYNYFKTHGYKEHVDAYTPIDVYITRLGGKDDEGGWDPLTGNMEIKESSLFGVNYNLRYDGDQRTKTRATIYHEFFHAVQQSLIGDKAYRTNSKKNNWFDEATGTYFEKLAISGISENGKKNFWYLWQGPIPEESGTPDGYGRGLLINYMSNKLGNDDWIKDCYDNWDADYSKFKRYMSRIDQEEADFAAKFYMEVIRNLVPLYDASYYYSRSRKPNEGDGEDRYLSSIRLRMDDKAKEKIKNGEEDAFPIVFTSPSFELGAYGGRVVGLLIKDIINNKVVDFTEDFPDKCQLKLEAEGGCRIQIIEFIGDNNKIIKGNVINDFKGQINKGYKYIVLVTSTQNKKQNVVLKATLEKEDLKEGIYTGKAKVTMGKKTVTVNNRVFFRLSRLNDGRWGLVVCEANGDYNGTSTIAPLTYDAKKKVYNGHRKFKQDVSSDPKIKKMTTGEVNCTMKVNLEEKEPVLIIDYDSKWTTWKWGFPTKEGVITHFEGKWVSELKGRNLQAGKEDKVIIVE